MTIFLCIVLLIELGMIANRDQHIAHLEQENAALRKKLEWKGVFASDLNDK